jgi:hypothetical protein
MGAHPSTASIQPLEQRYLLELRLLDGDVVAFAGALGQPAGVRVEITPSTWERMGHPVQLELRVVVPSSSMAGSSSRLYWMPITTYDGIHAMFRPRETAYPAVRVPAGIWARLTQPHVIAVQLRATPRAVGAG